MSKTNTNVLFIIFLILFALISYSVADIPAHCRKEKIEGEWKFTISNDKFTPSLSHAKTTCGHGYPDQIDQTIGDKDHHFDNSWEYTITLGSDYKAYQDKNEVGSWTPIYDEGFILNVGEKVFFNYMKYFKSNDDGPYKSNCDKTMVGWYIPDSNNKLSNWSCFYGNKVKGTVCKDDNFMKKVKNDKNHKSNNGHKDKDLDDKLDKKIDEKINQKIKNLFKLADITDNNQKDSEFIQKNHDTEDNLSLIQMKTQTINNLIHNKYEDQQHIVDELNSMGLTWTAGIHKDFVGMSLFELNNQPQIGIKRKEYINNNYKKIMGVANSEFSQNPSLLQVNTKKTGFKKIALNEEKSEVSDKEEDKEFNPSELKLKSQGKREPDSKDVKNYDHVIRYINKPIEEIDADSLPKNWDWRNVGGKNYVPEQRVQGGCGSCYIFSTLSSLEARLRIQTDLKDTTTFSRQFIVSCGIYTEGCKGGYPILVGKFANEFELVPDSCMPYKAKNTECSDRCDASSFKYKYTVDSYKYLGGYYGATSELEMMKEIRARGPMPGNISVPWTFSYYRGGIYANFHNKTPQSTINNTTMFDRHVTWEKVDHSILIIGWGEDNGIPYWLCMNTWGSHWGEGGYFKILRGKNECSIETMGDVMNIKREIR